MKNIVTFEKRPAGSTGYILLSRLLAVVGSAALLILVFYIAMEEKNNLGKVIERVFINPFFTERGIYTTIKNAVPLIIISLGICIAFQMKLWNIGGNGQMLMGGIFAAGIPFYFPNLPEAMFIPLMLAASLAGGAFWTALVAFPKAFLNVNETIVSLMLNYVAVIFTEYLILGPWRVKTGFAQAPTIPKAAKLPMFGKTGIGLTVFFALALLVIYFFVMKKTRFGYELRVTGESHSAARYAGMSVKKNIILALLLSGAAGGLAGYCLLAGTDAGGSISPQLHAGLGFMAVIVAWLSNKNPLGVLFMSLFLVGINNSTKNMQSFGLDASLTDLSQGVILFLVLAFDVLTRYKIRFFPNRKPKQAQKEGGDAA